MECKDMAAKILAMKDRTEKELRDKLSEKGYGPEEIENTVELMKRYNYINDRSYAEKYMSDAMKLRGLGIQRIRAELLRRGVDRYTVEETLAEAENGDDSERIAGEIERRFSSVDLGNPKERRRVFAYFARRGFPPHAIWGAINSKSAFKDVYWEE